MKKKWLWAFGLPVVALAAAVIHPTRSRAADHLDGPRAKGDPAADIADVYGFMSPDTTNGAGHVVIGMTVFPVASAASKFSDKVKYVFDIRQIATTAPSLDATVLDVTCTFTNATPQMATCTSGGPSALTKTVQVDAANPACGAADDICVFAGPRSDPFFFDLKGFNDTVDSMPQAPKFTGTNFFKGLNVLAIVVEMNATKAFGAGLIPPLGGKALVVVGAHTQRM